MLSYTYFSKLDIKLDEEKIIFIQSKSDLKSNHIQITSNSINISVKENRGIKYLLNIVSEKLSLAFSSHSKHDPILVSKRQRSLLLSAQEISIHALELANKEIETDILASIIHSLNDTLGEVVGNISNKDIVNNIFSEFCVGK